MRSYSEVIDKEGNKMFGKYMGGSNDMRSDGTSIIAYIYDVPEERVIKQINQRFKYLCDNHFKKRSGKVS